MSDWVDNHLISNLHAGCRVTVNGKGTSCGIPTTTQLHFKLKASKKTLLVLSESYAATQECKYIISVLEYLEYKSGTDQLLLITFQNNARVGKLLEKRHCFKPRVFLNVPADKKKWTIFWKCLNAIIQK